MKMFLKDELFYFLKVGWSVTNKHFLNSPQEKNQLKNGNRRSLSKNLPSEEKEVCQTDKVGKWHKSQRMYEKIKI